MSKYPGRIISATPPTVSLSEASGVWTLEEAAQYQEAGTWPVAVPGIVADPNFNQTVLLLHGDGTNGAQNNTFLDGSTNNFTITRNGNTTQGTFSPFSVGAGEWSNWFNGSTGYLRTPTDAAFGMSTGDFTIECWVYANAYSGIASVLIDLRAGSDPATRPCIEYGTTGALAYRVSGANRISGGTIPLNAWSHVALSRSGSTTKMFLNGVQVGSDYTDTNDYGASSRCQIGADDDGSSQAFVNGYISNVRVVKGRAVYTSAFTPGTVPLGATSGGTNPPQGTETSLLTCQANSFVDNGGLVTKNTITRNGDVRVTPFSPFAPSAAYDPAVNGGSGYFDGSGDYLSIADAAGLRFGTGNFTIQAWIYRSVAGAVHSIAAKGGASTGWVFQVHSDNKLRFTQTTTNIDSTGTIPAGSWTHVAVVREGTGTNQTKLYINGVNDGQATVTTDFNQTEQLNIGANRGNSSVMNGYIAGFKYVVGTAETITVPTAPPTGGTALLNFTNAGIFDNTGKNNLETVGNAQIDTATKKYGTGSFYTGATSGANYLRLPADPFYQFGTDNFTIEGWFQPLASGNERTFYLHGVNTTGGMTLFVGTGGVRFRAAGTTDLTHSTTISNTAFTHIAFVRDGNTRRIFINGTQVTSDTLSFNVSDNVITDIGASVQNASDSFRYFGYIDDLRITKGVARYTTTFTPPTQAFSDF